MSDNRHISRLKAMLEDCGNTWDLSTNDKAAIQYAVDRIAELERENAELRRDAERWRECERHVHRGFERWHLLTMYGGDTFAEAIDTAIAKRKEAT